MYLLKYSISVSKVRKKLAYYGRVMATKTLYLDDITKLIAGKGSTLTETDIHAVLRAESEVIAESLLAGNRVRLPHSNHWLGIDGAFENEKDSFRKGRNKIVPRASVGERVLKHVAEKAKMVRTRIKRGAELDGFLDQYSDLENRIVTIGEIARIDGDDLKFDKQDLEQGIFFVDAKGKEVRSVTYSSVGSKVIVCSVPALAKGAVYELQLRTRKVEGGKINVIALEANLKALDKAGADKAAKDYEAELAALAEEAAEIAPEELDETPDLAEVAEDEEVEEQDEE